MGRISHESQFSTLVGAVYEAASEPAGWDAVVALVKPYLNCSSVLINLEDVAFRKASFAVTDGLDDSLMDQYYRHYVFVDPNLTAKNKLPVGSVTASNQLMSDAQWENLEFYQDFSRHLDIFYQMGAYTHRGPDAFGAIGVHRTRTAPPFTALEISRLRRLVPHLRQAFRISSLLPGRQGTLSAALELHPHGVFLVDAHGRVVLANGRGETLLQQRDGLALVEGSLAAPVEPSRTALATAIHEAGLTGLGNGVHPGRALSIERPSGRTPYRVIVTPLHPPPVRFDAGTHRICAAVLVADPEAAPLAPVDALRQWYGLTPAEAQLAHALAQGESPSQVSERLGVSLATIRTQLKAVFSKTGVRRQAEFVRLLLLSPADPSDRADA